MPLPLIPIIVGAAAAAAGAGGVAAGVKGGKKLKDANDTMKSAEKRHKQNIETFENSSKESATSMDKLGELELKILHSFEQFTETFEKIHNKPDFDNYSKNNINLPKYEAEELNKASVGAGVLLGGLGGAALGTAGGFAAAGATTSAVMALGTASTGTAIASLSGAAATNATLAALGGGAIAAGGGGMALDSAILGGATLGFGLLVGGIIFNITGNKISEKADEAWTQMEKAEKQINTICEYLNALKFAAGQYYGTLETVNKIYEKHLNGLSTIVNLLNKTDWHNFSDDEKLVTENTVLLVNLLYQMCKVQIVIKNSDDEINTINYEDMNNQITLASDILEEKGWLEKLCPKCGYKLDKNHKFCPECGNKI